MKRNEIPMPAAGHRKAAATVNAALATLDYPISKQEAIRKIGEWEIPFTREVRVPMADLLQGVPADTFRDAGAAAAALDRHWGRLARNLAAVERAERAAAKRAPDF